jgi:NAD(P)-dependent dehydrogenase (short-subunit alcohol dehydrogenase family)
MSAVSGKACAITGAGSGIGRALAVELARRGARLSICDVDEAGLAETERLIGATDTHRARVDVSDREAVHAYAEAAAAHFGGVVHQIYNNAGIAFSRSVEESEYSDYERVLGVNLWGVIHGTKAFLPLLIASGDGHVVNVSSLNGFMAQSESSHYCTSKFAVRGFSESLRADLIAAGHRVGVTVVHPGGIKTNIANNALASARELGLPVTAASEKRRKVYNEKLLKMDPAQAARIVVDAVERDRPRVLVGRDAKVVDALVRLAPSHYHRFVARFDRRMPR